jgi:hypothetical protein
VKISSIRKALPESCLDFSSYYTFCRMSTINSKFLENIKTANSVISEQLMED